MGMLYEYADDERPIPMYSSEDLGDVDDDIDADDEDDENDDLDDDIIDDDTIDD